MMYISKPKLFDDVMCSVCARSHLLLQSYTHWRFENNLVMQAFILAKDQGGRRGRV